LSLEAPFGFIDWPLERQLTAGVHPGARNGSLDNGHLKVDFADWKEVFETAMAGQMHPAFEAGLSYACFKQNTAGHW
jgi:hypothetical protein